MILQITLKWLGNWLALLVLSMVAAQGLHFTATDIEPAVMLITLAVFVSWLAILLAPMNSNRKTQAGEVTLWAVLAAAGFFTLSFLPLYSGQGNNNLQLAGGVLILVLLFSAMQRLIRAYTSSYADTMMLFTLITGALFVAPLYMSAVAETTSHQVLVDAIIAASPVSYLAGIADYDYLRSNWFYQHTPFGGLRFNYPNPVLMTICYLATTFVLAGANILTDRPEIRTL